VHGPLSFARPAAYRASVEEKGFALVPDVLSDGEIAAILAHLDQLSTGKASRRGQMYAARNLLTTVPAIAKIAAGSQLRSLVDPILGSAFFSVRGLLLDKVPGANWHVGWHQDQIIPVAEQRNVPGFTAWSVKHGVPHVRPPATILEHMLTLRIHLDNCEAENGALRVIPESHRDGLLTTEQINDLLARNEPIVCKAPHGSVLVMRPLLLHASSPATSPSHRRVVIWSSRPSRCPAGSSGRDLLNR
jgi:ectoine hydroxylase-related dioxygenase (phytanoyl-CoA dioxygenase family)